MQPLIGRHSLQGSYDDQELNSFGQKNSRTIVELEKDESGKLTQIKIKNQEGVGFAGLKFIWKTLSTLDCDVLN